MNYIIKRDGRKVPFNKRKIENAIFKAFEEVDSYQESNPYGRLGWPSSFLGDGFLMDLKWYF